MRILILYATYSSGTKTASEVVAQLLTEYDNAVTLKQVKSAIPQEINDFDCIILASPSWWIDNKDGQPHDDFTSFMKKCEGLLFENKRFAIFGLGDSSYARFCGAVDYLTQFISQHKGILISDPLRIDGYYFDEEGNNIRLKEWVNKLV